MPNIVLGTAGDIRPWLDSVYQVLCNHDGDLCFEKIHRRPFGSAAVAYLTIILLVALFAIVRPRPSYVARVMNHNWSRTAAHHVWFLTLVIFLINGLIHAVAQTTLLTGNEATKSPLGGHLSPAELLRLSFNAPFCW
jgi:hypothetical protein